MPGRNCEGCTLCSKIFAIPEMLKQRHEWRRHCDIGKGCRIYDTRPETCRDFFCGYLLMPNQPEHWKPSKSRMVLTSEDNGRRLVIHVDTSRPDAWKKAPYCAEMRRMAATAARSRHQVIVWQGENAIAVLPDREKFLGRIGPGQIIVTTESDVPGGGDLDVEVMDAGDARLKTGG